MNLENRKDNTYYDKIGTQILAGDLLKVYHFTSGKRKYYMYQVAVMEETKDFPVMAMRDYNASKPHYRLYVVCNDQRIYTDAKIIHKKDFEIKRKRIKILNNG